MDLLEIPKIFLGGRKVLCIDDEIYHEESDRQLFYLKSGFHHEDVFFTDAFDSALEFLEKYPEISIIIADLRIPKNSQDFYDYNPENPDEEWGEKLIKEIEKRYFNQREIHIIVISAYTFFSYTNSKKDSTILAFQEKPIDYKLLNKNLEPVLVRDLDKAFNYDKFSPDTREFIQQRTQNIKTRIQRIGEDIIAIGQSLIEVKEKLGFGGQFAEWLRTEFQWSDRQARRYMGVARKFGGISDKLSELNINRSAYWVLAEEKTSPEVVEKVLTLAENTGIQITPSLVEEIRSKHLEPRSNESRRRQKTQPSQESSSEGPKTENIEPEVKNQGATPNLAPSQPKIEILSVQRNTIANSYWQLGSHHRLFCGEPQNVNFLNLLPEKIDLAIGLPPNNDKSLIPDSKSEYGFVFHSKHDDIDVETISETIKEILLDLTDASSIVVFFYIYHPQLLELADSLDCRCFVAEPDLSKCDRILEIWRKKENVSRIKLAD